MQYRKQTNERGAIMLEGMIVTVITLLILVWILGLGFLYYQKYTVRIITNDAATKIGSTYYNPSSDIIIGYVNTADISNRSLYSNPDLKDVNEKRAESYVKYILNKANFAGTVKDVKVDLDFFQDGSFGRSHVYITTSCTFNTPFSEGLEFFGMRGVVRYEVTAYAESTDLTGYVSTVNFCDQLDSFITAGTGVVDKAVKCINSFVKFCNHLK